MPSSQNLSRDNRSFFYQLQQNQHSTKISTQEEATILASAVQQKTRIAEISKLIAQQLPDPETMERVLLRMKKLSLEDVILKTAPIPISHLFFFTANMIISKKYVADMW
jgi:hypothetical protein